MKQLGISSEQELKLLSRIMPLLRTKGGNLLDQKAIKRKTDQDTVKKSNIQAQMKKIQSLQVDVNNHKNAIGYTTWSQGYDLKRAREKEKEMEHTDKRQRAQIQAKDEEIDSLASNHDVVSKPEDYTRWSSIGKPWVLVVICGHLC